MTHKLTIPENANAIVGIDHRRRPHLVACLPTMPYGLADSVTNEPESTWSDDFSDDIAPGVYYARLYYEPSQRGRSFEDVEDDAWLEIDLLGPCLDGGATAFVVADMQLARTLLTAVWRLLDAAGESMGRSPRNVALETAMALIDAHFDKDPALQADLDTDRAAFVDYCRDIVVDRRLAAVAVDEAEKGGDETVVWRAKAGS